MTIHALSFDVENWYDGSLHRDAFQGPQDGRVVPETERVLEVLGGAGVRGTFFILGRVARQHPQLVRRVAEAGHEVACHGYDHVQLFRLSPATLLSDLRFARATLQDLSGQPVLGFRAPTWSIDARNLHWAPAVIAEAGFSYDSSIFPLRTPFYGLHQAPVTPWQHVLEGGRQLVEFPPAVAAFGPLRIPFGGGIYWRLLPERIIAWLLRRSTAPEVIYLHPWELNPEHVPVGNGISWVARGVLTVGVRRGHQPLQRLMSQFQFGPIGEVFAREISTGVRLWPGLQGCSGARRRRSPT